MKIKRFFLVLLAMLLVLSVFTACDDDDNSSVSLSSEEEAIYEAIVDALDTIMGRESLYSTTFTITYSGNTITYTFRINCTDATQTPTVTISKGGTITINNYNDDESKVYIYMT